MFLVTKGMPFDVAFGCEDDFRLAAVSVVAGFEGYDTDWGTLTFTKRIVSS